VLSDRDLATRLSAHGRRTIGSRHTCAHRVDELLDIVVQLGQRSEPVSPSRLAAAS
jgi:hypothetical protein